MTEPRKCVACGACMSKNVSAILLEDCPVIEVVNYSDAKLSVETSVVTGGIFARRIVLTIRDAK